MQCSRNAAKHAQPIPALAPPWGQYDTWLEINRTIDDRTTHHKADLTTAMEQAENIKNALMQLYPIMDTLCLNTCRFCPDPCCLYARVWVDFRDLLFMHLAGAPIPYAQLITPLKMRCRYISPKGCLLPRISRPWACTWYLCHTQMTRLRNRQIDAHQIVHALFEEIKKSRKKMEDIFINVLLQ